MDNNLIDAGTALANLGWRVCPSSTKRKHPPYRDWQQLATSSTAEWNRLVECYGGKCDAISVQWGPSSGVIDLDFDDEESYERFREKYLTPNDINGLAAEVRPPMFRSGRRGTPHLIFKFNRRLPEKANVSCRSMGYEIDAKLGWNDLGSQSLVPPSPRYAWEVGRAPWEIEVPELPPLAIDLLLRASRGGTTKVARVGLPPNRRPTAGQPPTDTLSADALAAIEETGLTVDEVLAMTAESKPAEEWVRIEQGVPEGERHNATLSLVGREARQMAPLDLQHLIKVATAYAEKCRPPLEAAEAEKIASDVFDMELLRRQREGGKQQGKENKMKSREQMQKRFATEYGEILEQVRAGEMEAADALRTIAARLSPFHGNKLRDIADWLTQAAGTEVSRESLDAIATAEGDRRRAEGRGRQADENRATEDSRIRAIAQELAGTSLSQGGSEDPDNHDVAAGEPREALLRLERVECGLDPVEWRLYAADGLFARVRQGYVPLRTEDLCRWRRVRDAILEANGTLPIPDDRHAQRTWSQILEMLYANARTTKLPASRSLRALHAQTALDLMHACLQPDDLKDVCVPEIQTGLEAGWQAQYPLAVALPDGEIAVSVTALRVRMRTVIGNEFNRTVLNRALEAAGATDRPRREVVQAAKRGPLPSSISGSKLAVISEGGRRILSEIADGTRIG